MAAIQLKEGWFTGEGIRRQDSPNCDPRPFSGVDSYGNVSLLVIHNISLPPGQFGGSYVDQLFTNCLKPADHEFFERIVNIRVSAHLFINRQGDVTQYVSLKDRAWHAGVSVFRGKENCNDFSIGIELEGTDDQPYTDRQYQRLAEITRQIMLEYPQINTENIVGHCDIAPGRKTDPGASFNWQHYRSLITDCV
jgi:N-acetyl-anhydromuramoyl-L-alanine amidase